MHPLRKILQLGRLQIFLFSKYCLAQWEILWRFRSTRSIHWFAIKKFNYCVCARSANHRVYFCFAWAIWCCSRRSRELSHDWLRQRRPRDTFRRRPSFRSALFLWWRISWCQVWVGRDIDRSMYIGLPGIASSRVPSPTPTAYRQDSWRLWLNNGRNLERAHNSHR